MYHEIDFLHNSTLGRAGRGNFTAIATLYFNTDVGYKHMNESMRNYCCV